MPPCRMPNTPTISLRLFLGNFMAALQPPEHRKAFFDFRRWFEFLIYMHHYKSNRANILFG